MMEQMRERVARAIVEATHRTAFTDGEWRDLPRELSNHNLRIADAALSLMQPEIDRRVAEEKARTTIADALWDAQTALSLFEDELYDRLGGDAVDPFSHIGHDWYDRSIEIYDLCESVTLSDDDLAFIHAAGFPIIYTDRTGNPDLAVKMRRWEKARLLEALREPSREIVIDLAASLAAAISLLERGGKAAKKAAPSDKMFDQMVEDYKASLNRARKAFEEAGEIAADNGAFEVYSGIRALIEEQKIK